MIWPGFADRWHLGKNLTESVSTLLARCRAEIRRALHVQGRPVQERAEVEPVLEEEKRPARTHREKQAQLARHAQKRDRYEQVLELHDQGLTVADVGSRVGLSGRTVQRWLAHGSFPEARRRRRRPSLIDPYERYVPPVVASGKPQWLTTVSRTDSPRIQGFIQSHVSISGKATVTSKAHVRVAPVETAQAEERPSFAHPTGKLLCAAC
jgi:hypothetical protein